MKRKDRDLLPLKIIDAFFDVCHHSGLIFWANTFDREPHIRTSTVHPDVRFRTRRRETVTKTDRDLAPFLVNGAWLS